MMVSESHVEPETLARIPVIGLIFRFGVFSWKRSPRVCDISVVMMTERAASRLGSPKNADILSLPAGTVNEKRPFSSASVTPIGIQ